MPVKSPIAMAPKAETVYVKNVTAGKDKGNYIDVAVVQFNPSVLCRLGKLPRAPRKA